jgi:hypothetical protein
MHCVSGNNVQDMHEKRNHINTVHPFLYSSYCFYFYDIFNLWGDQNLMISRDEVGKYSLGRGKGLRGDNHDKKEHKISNDHNMQNLKVL